MLMASLPPAARNPETVKQLLSDPGMKQKLVAMLAQQVWVGGWGVCRLAQWHMMAAVS